MITGSWRNDSSVVGIDAARNGVSSFDTSEYALFWREASQAVALSRKGRVHLVSRVNFDVIRGLHEEAKGVGPHLGRMPIAIVCKDSETLGGEMLRGIKRESDGWRMGDGQLVKFYEVMPGPEAGTVGKELMLRVPDRAKREMEELQRVMEARASKARERAN